MVPVVGLEPTLLAELDFESSASTNSTTPASACESQKYVVPILNIKNNQRISMTHIRSLSELLSDYCETLRTQNLEGNLRVKIDDILDAFHERGFGMILFIFALPMALPLPVPPGINILLASPLILLTAQQALGLKEIWLPQKIRQKSLSARSLIKMFDKAIPFVQKIELLAKPRLGFLTQGLTSNLIGLAGLIMALTICIPLPLTNTVPSLGIACMAVGVLIRDGLAVLVGGLIGLLWVSLWVYAGEAGIRYIIDLIF